MNEEAGKADFENRKRATMGRIDNAANLAGHALDMECAKEKAAVDNLVNELRESMDLRELLNYAELPTLDLVAKLMGRDRY